MNGTNERTRINESSIEENETKNPSRFHSISRQQRQTRTPTIVTATYKQTKKQQQRIA